MAATLCYVDSLSCVCPFVQVQGDFWIWSAIRPTVLGGGCVIVRGGVFVWSSRIR